MKSSLGTLWSFPALWLQPVAIKPKRTFIVETQGIVVTCSSDAIVLSSLKRGNPDPVIVEIHKRNQMGERRVCNKKSQESNWKNKLRSNCCKRVREDRSRLLWKFRSLATHKEVMDFTFRDIVSDELKKIKDSSISVAIEDDDIWDYDDHQKNSQSPESEWEEIMIEMQRIFYEDLRVEETRREQAEYGEPWEDEDDYLETALEQLQLNNGEISKKEVWCPICKREIIHVNLDVLRTRLAEVHTDHLERGCRLAPNFCLETRFSLTALYIRCETCNTFEIVL